MGSHAETTTLTTLLDHTGPQPTADMSGPNNLSKFVLEAGPEECSVKCRITRNCKGLDKGIYPTYFLHYEQDNGRRIFLLAGRKRKKCSTSTYVLSTDPTDLSRQGKSTLATLRSNLLGTVFSITRPSSGNSVEPRAAVYTKAVSQSCEHLNRPQSTSDHSSGGLSDHSCCGAGGARIVPHVPHLNPHLSPANHSQKITDIASVIYQPNILGIAGPRKMKVLLPLPSLASVNTVMCGGAEGGRTLIEKYKDRDLCSLVLLHSKDAAWDRKLNSYVLNYKGRANQASVKNFQLCHSHNPDLVIMQLGKVEQDVFIMDFRYPLSALQAFGIALSSFDCKIACE